MLDLTRIPGCIVNGVATLNCIKGLFINTTFFAITFAGVVLLFFIVYSSVKFITSSGDPGKIASARKSLTYALIGFILITGAFLIISFVSKITQIPCEVIGLNCGAK